MEGQKTRKVVEKLGKSAKAFGTLLRQNKRHIAAGALVAIGMPAGFEAGFFISPLTAHSGQQAFCTRHQSCRQ